MQVKLYLESKPNKSGAYKVKVSISFFGRRAFTSLGEPMTKAEFEALNADFNGTPIKQKVRHTHHKDLLRKLRSLSDAVDWELQKVSRGEIAIEQVNISDVVATAMSRERKEKEKPLLFEHCWLQFILEEAKAKDLAESTRRRLLQNLNIYKTYKPGLTLAEMTTHEGISAFMQWNIDRGLNNVSAMDYWRFLHWFLQWCYGKGLCDDTFKTYKVNLKQIDKKEKLVVFLTMEEIAQIEALDIDGNIGLTRDVFLFQCYTGLRRSDAWNVLKSDISNGYLTITIKKTGQFLQNKLNKQALRIVEKYIGAYPEDIYLFPQLNRTSVDTYVKKIARLAGIDTPVRKIEYRNHERIETIVPKWQLVSTHVGRKSFIVNSLDMGLTATQVCEYSGHSSIQAMEPYISISRKKKDSAMDAWDAQAEPSQQNKG